MFANTNLPTFTDQQAESLRNKVVASIKRPRIAASGNLHRDIASYLASCEVPPVTNKGGQWDAFKKRTGYGTTVRPSTAMFPSVNTFIVIGSFGSVWVDAPFGRIGYNPTHNIWYIVEKQSFADALKSAGINLRDGSNVAIVSG